MLAKTISHKSLIAALAITPFVFAPAYAVGADAATPASVEAQNKAFERVEQNMDEQKKAHKAQLDAEQKALEAKLEADKKALKAEIKMNEGDTEAAQEARREADEAEQKAQQAQREAEAAKQRVEQAQRQVEEAKQQVATLADE